MSDKLEQLRAMKAAKEEKERADAEAKEKAASQEATEAKRSELSAKRESLGEQLAAAEGEAKSAQEQVAEAEGYADMGDDAKELIAAIKVEAEQKVAAMEGLKAELATIDAEIAALEGGESAVVAETSEAAEAAVAEAAAAEASPDAEEAALEEAQEAYGALQDAVSEKVKKLSVESLSPEAAAAMLQELKSDRLALLKGFNELTAKVPLKEGKRAVGEITKAAREQFGGYVPGTHEPLFDSVNEAIDSIARKIDGVKAPRIDAVISQRGWANETQFGEAELAEFLKQAEDAKQDNMDFTGSDANVATLVTLEGVVPPSRLDEPALRQYEAFAQKAIDAIPADVRDKRTDDRIKNLQASISLAKRKFQKGGSKAV
jgi:hypothetical protein